MPAIATKACWFGEGRHKNRAPQISTPKSPAWGFISLQVKGFAGPQDRAWHPALRLDPQWGEGTC